jgi:O-antigen ligase
MGLVAVVLGPWRTSVSHEVVRMVKVAVLFLVLANEFRRRAQMRHVALALLTGVLFQSLVAITQYFTQSRFGLQVLGEPGEEATKSLEIGTLLGSTVYRVGGLMAHPNVLAAYIAMTLPIGVGLLFTRVSVWQKLFIGLTLMAGEAALIATLSRSGWICFGMAVTLVLLFTFANRQMRRHYLLLRVAFLCLLVLVGATFSGAIVDRLVRSDPSAVATRFHLAEIAWKMIRDRPLLGCGLNTYVFEMVPYTEVPTPAGVTRKYGEEWPAVHNIYLLVWAEQGLVGLALFLLVHLAILRTAWRNLRVEDEVLFAINIGCMFGILAVMLDGMVSFTLRFSGPLRVFWTLAALIVAIRWWHRRQAALSAASLTAG